MINKRNLKDINYTVDIQKQTHHTLQYGLFDYLKNGHIDLAVDMKIK